MTTGRTNKITIYFIVVLPVLTETSFYFTLHSFDIIFTDSPTVILFDGEEDGGGVWRVDRTMIVKDWPKFGLNYISQN